MTVWWPEGRRAGISRTTAASSDFPRKALGWFAGNKAMGRPGEVRPTAGFRTCGGKPGSRRKRLVFAPDVGSAADSAFCSRRRRLQYPN